MSLVYVGCSSPPKETPDLGGPIPDAGTVLVCHEGQETLRVMPEEATAHFQHGDTEGACPSDAGDAGVDSDAGEADVGALDLGVDAGEIDMGRPEPTLEIVSEPPAFGIAGVEYRYQPVVRSNIESLSYTLINGPADAMLVDGQLFWTPADGTGASFEIEIRGVGLSQSQSFVVQVAEPTAVITSTIARRWGGMITVENTNTALDGLVVTIPPGELEADTPITIATLSGPTEPTPTEHTELMPPFVILPELPGVSIEVSIPVPDGVTLAQDEFPLVMSAAADLPLEPGARGRFQDAVIVLSDLDPAEANRVDVLLKASARSLKLVSGRYLRLVSNNITLYWNLAAGETPPTADAERVMVATEQSHNALIASHGCTMPQSLPVFVVGFTNQSAGFAVLGAYYLTPNTARDVQPKLEYVIAHEMVHVAQWQMIRGWRYTRVQGWWAEAMATAGADEIFNSNTFATYNGPMNEDLLTRGLIGSSKDSHQYRLSAFMKHLKAKRRLPFCQFIRAHAASLATNRFADALAADTGEMTFEHLSTFAAALSAHRRPYLIEDVEAMPIRFTPQQHTLGDEPITVSFTNIAGAKAQVVSPSSTDPVTVIARSLSFSGNPVRVSFFQEKNGALDKLNDLVDTQAVLGSVLSRVEK